MQVKIEVDKTSDAMVALERLAHVGRTKYMTVLQRMVQPKQGKSGYLKAQYINKWKYKTQEPYNVYQVVKAAFSRAGGNTRGYFTRSSFDSIGAFVDGQTLHGGFMKGTWPREGAIDRSVPFSKILPRLYKMWRFGEGKATTLYPSGSKVTFDEETENKTTQVAKMRRIKSRIRRQDLRMVSYHLMILMGKIDPNAKVRVVSSEAGVQVQWPEGAKKHFGLENIPNATVKMSGEPYKGKRWNKGRWSAEDFFSIDKDLEQQVWELLHSQVEAYWDGNKWDAEAVLQKSIGPLKEKDVVSGEEKRSHINEASDIARQLHDLKRQGQSKEQSVKTLKKEYGKTLSAQNKKRLPAIADRVWEKGLSRTEGDILTRHKIGKVAGGFEATKDKFISKGFTRTARAGTGGVSGKRHIEFAGERIASGKPIGGSLSPRQRSAMTGRKSFAGSQTRKGTFGNQPVNWNATGETSDLMRKVRGAGFQRLSDYNNFTNKKRSRGRGFKRR